MTTDFRAELQALVDAYDENGGKWPQHHEYGLFVAFKRARAALAKPEPEKAPVWTEGICGDGAALLRDGVMVPIEEVVQELNEGAQARAVLARWGRPAPQSADGEVAEAIVDLRQAIEGAAAMGWERDVRVITRAAELLERLSPPQPVPVSERLPGPGDCDDLGRVWWWYPETAGALGYWQWEADAMERQEDEQPSHWLPAHALPVPQ